MRLSDERLAKNEAHFRKVNERLKEISTPWAKTTDYLCECSAATCIETIELTKEEYERARARPTTFLLIPGTRGPIWKESSNATKISCWWRRSSQRNR